MWNRVCDLKLFYIKKETRSLVTYSLTVITLVNVIV